MSYELGKAMCQIIADHLAIEPRQVVSFQVSGDLITVVYAVAEIPSGVSHVHVLIDPSTGGIISSTGVRLSL